MPYPASIETFTRKVDGVNRYKAADINELQSIAEKIQNELGTDPAGSFTDVKTRLDNIDVGVWGIITPQKYGALGDGNSDDTDAFDDTFSEAESLGGAAVFVPSGIYRIRHALNPPSNCLLFGGQNSVIKMADGDQSLLTQDMTVGSYTCTVADGSIFAVGDGVTVTDDSAALTQVNVAKITNIEGNVLTLDNSADVQFDVSDNARCAQVFTLVYINQKDNVIIRDIKFDGNRGNVPPYIDGGGPVGVFMYLGSNITIKNCIFDGINGDSIGTQGTTNVKIRGNTVINAGHRGFHIGGASPDVIVTDNYINGNWTAWDAIDATGYQDLIYYCANTSGVLVENNILTDGYIGIRSIGGSGVGDSKTIVKGNEIYNIQVDGIRVLEEATEVDISDNLIYNCGSRSIYCNCDDKSQTSEIIISRNILFDHREDTEILNETDFATHAKWDTTGDFDATVGEYIRYLYSSDQTSTLTQTAANRDAAGEDATWYKFTYTIDVTTVPDGLTLTLETFSQSSISLPYTDGIHTVYFYSAPSASTADFAIKAVSSGASQGEFTIDDVECIEVEQDNGIRVEVGDVYALSRLNIQNNIIYGLYGHGIVFINMDSGYGAGHDYIISGNQCYNNKSAGIYARGITDAIISNNICAENKTIGIQIAAGRRININNNLTRNNQQHGINLISHDSEVTTEVSLLGNHCISNNRFGSSYNGIDAEDATHIRAIANYVKDNYDGIQLFKCDNIAIISNELLDNEANGIIVDGTGAASTPNDIIIFGNTCDNNALNGILVRYADNVLTLGNMVISSGNNGIISNNINNMDIISNLFRNNQYRGIYVASGSSVTGLSIRNNRVIANNQDGASHGGINITDVEGIQISGNFVTENARGIEINSGCDYSSIVANQVLNNIAHGVIIDSEYCVIVGNQISDTQGVPTQTYGIYEDTNADNNLIFGNILKNNITNGIRALGANSVIAYNIGHRYVNWGSATDTTDANGNITIAHGLATTPTYVTVAISGDNTWDAIVESVDATNITVRVRNTTDNSDITAQSVTVYWTVQV